MRRLSALSLGFLMGCGGGAPPAPPGSVERLETVEFTGVGDHLTKLVRYRDFIYVANANNAFVGLEFDATTGFTTLFETGALERCASLAVHEASASLYCGNEETGELLRFDLSDPADPRLDQRAAFREPSNVAWPVYDLHVLGDDLWVGAYDSGLFRVPLGEAGALGDAQLIAAPGNVRTVRDDGERIVALVAGTGVLVFESEGDSWNIAREITIDAPLMDLDVTEGRVAVAMGSLGAAVYDLDTGERLQRMDPKGVVTSVLMDEDWTVVGALSGVSVYPSATGSSEGEGPQMHGWIAGGVGGDPSNILDLAWWGDEVLVSDWSQIHRLGVRSEGIIRELEAVRGEYRPADQPISIRLRNPSPHARVVRVTVPQRPSTDDVGSTPLLPFSSHGPGDPVAILRLGPLEEGRFELPDDPRLAAFEPGVVKYVTLELQDESGAGLSTSRVEIYTSDFPDGDQAPPAGARFPDSKLMISPEQLPLATLELPLAERQMLVFYSDDCQAMWPEVEDLAWLARHENAPHDGTVVLLSENVIHAVAGGFIDRAQLEGTVRGLYEHLPDAFVEFNELSPFYESLQLPELGSAAYHSTDYVIDAEGVVESVERTYRGLHAIAPPPPNTP